MPCEISPHLTSLFSQPVQPHRAYKVARPYLDEFGANLYELFVGEFLFERQPGGR